MGVKRNCETTFDDNNPLNTYTFLSWNNNKKNRLLLIKNEIIFQLVFINNNLLNDFVICTPDRQFHFYGTFKYTSLRRLAVLNYRCVRDLFNNMSFLIRPFRAFPTDRKKARKVATDFKAYRSFSSEIHVYECLGATNMSR